LGPTGPRQFEFGGTADAATIQPGLFAFDARPGHERWPRIERVGEPPIRSIGVAVYDSDADRPWFGFGNSSSEAFGDLTPLGY
jgi:hypothetical protein